ncbi:MAG: alpha/beta hydrolase [Alphaproteobacteria bacterium]|nr:alpha/beta hydrolase [Alphaproteobacteria bacterium]
MDADDLLLDLTDRRIRGRWIARAGRDDGYARPTLVFLHEGLGCVEMWRDFPAALCAATGFAGFAYDRTGYGRSSPWPKPPGTAYMHVEAEEVLPRVLEAAGIGEHILIGHSDGGSVALISAGHDPETLQAVVTLAAHVVCEADGVASIRRARVAFDGGELRARLAKYHRDVDGAFNLWADAWLDPAFMDWSIEDRLPGVQVPVQAIQGEDDEYGSELQLGLIAGKVAGYSETRLIPACGHSPHLQQPQRTLAEIARFIGPFATLGDE